MNKATNKNADLFRKIVSITSSAILLVFVVGAFIASKNGGVSSVFVNRHIVRLCIVLLAAGALSHAAMLLLRRINAAEALVKKANEAKHRKIMLIYKAVAVSSGAMLLIFLWALSIHARSGDFSGIFANRVFVKACTAALSLGTFAPPFIALFLIMKEAKNLENTEEESEGTTA